MVGGRLDPGRRQDRGVDRRDVRRTLFLLTWNVLANSAAVSGVLLLLL